MKSRYVSLPSGKYLGTSSAAFHPLAMQSYHAITGPLAAATIDDTVAHCDLRTSAALAPAFTIGPLCDRGLYYGSAALRSAKLGPWTLRRLQATEMLLRAASVFTAIPLGLSPIGAVLELGRMAVVVLVAGGSPGCLHLGYFGWWPCGA